MTLLATCQAVADEIGLNAPAAIVGNFDLTAKRLLQAAQAAGQDLYRAHNWSILQREETITTVASTSNYAVPDDFGRLVSDTLWDATNFWRLRGAVSPQEWQRLNRSIISPAGLRRHVRLLQGPLAGSVLVYPTPAASGDSLIYEYISRYWCESSGGAGQAAWAADTDAFRIDDELLRMSTLWRTKRALGMVYADERDDFDLALKRARQADLALPITNMAPAPIRDYPTIPEGSWPDGS